jgi:5'-nucleotidase
MVELAEHPIELTERPDVRPAGEVPQPADPDTPTAPDGPTVPDPVEPEGPVVPDEPVTPADPTPEPELPQPQAVRAAP